MEEFRDMFLAIWGSGVGNVGYPPQYRIINSALLMPGQDSYERDVLVQWVGCDVLHWRQHTNLFLIDADIATNMIL